MRDGNIDEVVDSMVQDYSQLIRHSGVNKVHPAKIL